MKKSILDGAGSLFGTAVDIIYLGILWLVCCLPVVTIGPASTALYHAMVKAVRHGRGYAGRSFLAAFKSNFKSSLKAWLLFLVLILLWLINSYVTGQTDPEGAKLMSRLSSFLIIPVCFPLPWTFAYISRFENSTGDSLKLSVYLSIKNFMRTLAIFLITAAFVLLCMMLPVLIPLMPGFCCLAISSQIEPVFKVITESMENDSNEDKWYNE